MSILHIASRELRSVLTTVIGWLVLSGFLLIAGVFFSSGLTMYLEQVSAVVDNPYADSHMSLIDHFMAPFFGNLSIILVMMCPALSMRVFSEEYKQGTIALLLTSPVSSAEIVLGKFLGIMGFVCVILMFTAYAPIVLMTWGNPDLGAMACGYVMLLLMAGVVVSLGMFVSSTTSNQLVALVVSFSAALSLFILHWLNADPDSLFYALSLSSHMEDLTKGRVRLSDLAYYFTLISVFLFATHQRVERLRWT